MAMYLIEMTISERVDDERQHAEHVVVRRRHRMRSEEALPDRVERTRADVAVDDAESGKREREQRAVRVAMCRICRLRRRGRRIGHERRSIISVPPMRVARRLIIGGRVQGVGFRYFTQEAAVREGVTGWVRESARTDGGGLRRRRGGDGRRAWSVRYPPGAAQRARRDRLRGRLPRNLERGVFGRFDHQVT